MPAYTVLENKHITPTTLLLTLQRDEYERPLSFQAGQYAAISYEHRGKRSAARCFSIVSPPTDQDTLQFSMRIHGHYTTALQRLQKDDIVQVRGPFGGFVIDVNRVKNAVFLAGGIGITPFLSMMRHLSTIHADNNVTLLYSSPTQDDIAFKDELLAINHDFPNLKTVFVIGKGPTDALPAQNVATGRITPELIDSAVNGNYQDQKFFICGPPGFMKAMTANIAKKGVDKKRIVTEAFSQSSPRQTSVLRSWPANIYAMGIVGVILSGIAVMVSDLLRVLPPTTTARPTANTPFLVTNDRKKQLDQLVNTIPPSPDVITVPTTPKKTQSSSSTTTVPTQQSAPPTFAPVYVSAPVPRTTASAPPP